MTHRYISNPQTIRLRSEIANEERVLARLEERLRNFVPEDSRRYRTNYDYAHFMDTNKQDIRVAIENRRGRIRDLERQLEVARKRLDPDYDENEELIY